MKKKEIANIIGGELMWAVLWGSLMLIALGIFASTNYTLGYESGVHNGIKSAMTVQPIKLQNSLEICSQDLISCQSEQEQASSALQLCEDKLIKAKRLTVPYAVCVREIPAGMTEEEYEASGFVPISCVEYWKLYKEVFGD